MAINDYKPKNGEEIRVKIIREGEGSDAGRTPKRRSSALLKATKPDDYLPRRLKTGAIRFFDLIRPVAGAEIFASFTPVWTRPANSLAIGFAAITEAEAGTLVNETVSLLLATAAGDWPATFERVRKGEVYERAILASYDIDGNPQAGDLSALDEWTEAGLKLPADSVADLQLTGSFLFDCTVDFGDLSNFKITAEPSIDAPAVAFTPSPAMDIFLAPEIVFSSGNTQYYNGLHVFTDVNGTHSDLIEYVEELNYVYSVIPRNETAAVLAAFDAAGYGFYFALWQILKRLPAVRFTRGKWDFHESPPYDYFVVWFDPAVSEFPFSGIYTPTGIVGATNVSNINYGANFGYGLAFDRLSFAIRKGGQTFYFWRLVA